MTDQELLASEEFKAEVAWMLVELESNKLEVTLSEPIDHTGAKLRLVSSRNCGWYQELFTQHHNGRKGKKSRNDIRKHRIIPILNSLVEGKCKRTTSYAIIFDLVKDRVYNGYEVEGYFIKPTITKGE